MTLTGSAAQIDAALGAANNVLYHGAFDFSGIEHLTMTSSDGTLSDTDVLNLGVFKQIAAMEIYGITRPALTLNSSGHIILDAATSEFVAAYGSKVLYARRTGGDAVSTGRRARFPSGVSRGSAAEMRVR